MKVRAQKLERSHSHSVFGDHALTYYRDFEAPPRGFDVEWGHLSGFDGSYNPGWLVYRLEDLIAFAYTDLTPQELEAANEDLEQKSTEIRDAVSDLLSLIQDSASGPLKSIASDVAGKIGDAFEEASAGAYAKRVIGGAPRVTRDSRNISQGMRTPVHVALLAQIHFVEETAKALSFTANSVRRILSAARLAAPESKTAAKGSKIFIGHGRSPLWRELRDYLEKELSLTTEEFNAEPVAGLAIQSRLDEMLKNSAMAFLVMTAEDEARDGSKRARENVIHEVGLFQGYLGWTKAIVLLEDGCSEFSNLHGINHIGFRVGSIRDTFVDVRRALAREGLVSR